MPWPIILASTSKYRRELLSKLGWPFESESPGIDEDAYKGRGTDPEKLAKELSRLKAKAVFDLHPETCVIGSDQICQFGTQILGKPVTREKAVEQLMSMQGRSHQLLTAVTVMNPLKVISFVNTTNLHMRKLTLGEVSSYVDFDLPFDCAGSYKLESRGITLFTKIDMTDHTAIIGLPLIELTNVLVACGYTL